MESNFRIVRISGKRTRKELWSDGSNLFLVVYMNTKIRVQIKGCFGEIGEFIDFLKEQNTHYTYPKRSKEEGAGKWYHSGYLYDLSLLVYTLTTTILVELTKETLKSILKWLKERRDKGLKNPELEILVRGNVFKLNNKNTKLLMKMLEGIEKNKKVKRKRRRKHENTSQNEV